MRTIVALIGLALCSLALLAADISGTWAAAVVLDAGSGTATFVFKQTGETLTGTYSGAVGSANLTGTVKGSDVEWSFDGGDAGKISYKGKVDASGKIAGTVEYGQLGSGKFTAEKQK
jgi:L-seryl-tRNA(Ser) seleniumtransferase